MNLYELSGQYRTLYDMLDEAEDEEQINALIHDCDEIESDIKAHIESLAKVCKQLAADAANIKHEQDRLKKLYSSTIKKLDSVKQYTESIMRMNGFSKVSGTLASVSIRNCPESVQVYDLEQALQSGYLKSLNPTEDWLDKAEIKRAMQSGKVIPGCELVRNTTLTIK